MTIADYLLARFAQLGIRHLFGVPGDYNLWFLEEVTRSRDVEFVGCCTELNASYAADGYARTQGMGAIVTTYGVGELSAIGGVAGAYAEKVPVICITGAPPLSAIESGALLHHTLADGNYANMMDCYRNFTVAQTRITPSTARLEIDRVLRACWREKRPVYLQLPSDVAAAECGPAPEPLDLNSFDVDDDSLARALDAVLARLEQSNTPALLIDADADRYGLAKPLIALSEAANLPIAHVVPARGVIPDHHPNAVGIYRGAGSAPQVRNAVENSDCLISIGVRFTDVATGLFSHRIKPGVMIDVQPFHVTIGGRRFDNVPSAMLLDGIASTITRRRSVPIERPASDPSPSAIEPGRTLTQSEFWKRIQSFLREDDVLIADTGTSFFASSGLHLPPGARYFGQPIWGALGFGLPATLGACFAQPERRHLLFLGDGALQISAQELSTVIWFDQKPVIFLLNNAGFTIERLIYGPQSRYNDVNPWNYTRLPEIFGAGSASIVETVSTVGELDAALARITHPTKLYFIEVILPPMDAPEALIRFAPRAAEFDFPQIRAGVK